MSDLFDKPLLFFMCFTSIVVIDEPMLSVVVMLSAVSLSALCGYFEKKIPVIISLAYVAVCLFEPMFAVFLPLTVYELAGANRRIVRFAWLAALPFLHSASNTHQTAVTAAVCAAAMLLKYRASANLKMKAALYNLSDESNVKTDYLEIKNRELTEKQDYEVRLATLKERNRIAREIHDNVGHLLTRTILQLDALIITRSGIGAQTSENTIDDNLLSIKNGLAEAMDSVRTSVHDLYNESVDLKQQLEAIVNAFGFCAVKLQYDSGELPPRMRAFIIATVREALSNIARHSNATSAFVNVTEHPAFCRLEISDNGTRKPSKHAQGIGLQNMADAVAARRGVFKAQYDNGFKIFITIPMKEGFS